MNIGEPRRTIEVIPTTVPIPEELPMPEPARGDPEPAPVPVPVGAPGRSPQERRR
jgi:hypothetical protein